MTKTTRRRTLAALGATATAGTVATAGCLSSDNGDSPAVPELTDLGNREASEEVDIDVWLSIGAADVLQEIADDFTEQSETIDVTVTEEGDYNEVWTQLQQASEAGTQPAVAHLNAISTLPAWALDVITPVEQLIGDELDFDDFVDAVGNYYIIDDELMGLPLGVSTVIAGYNRSAFEAAGLPSHPDDVSLETFGDWAEISQPLIDETGVSHAVTWPALGWFYEAFLSVSNEELLDNDNGRTAPATRSNLDGAIANDIFQQTADLYNDDFYLYSDDFLPANQAFISQEVAVQLNTSAALGVLAAETEFEFDVTTVPAVSGADRGGSIIGGGALFVPQGLSRPETEAAAEFILWLSEPEQQARWHMETGYYPTSDQAEQIADQQGFYEQAPQFQRALQQFKQRPETPATAGALTFDHPEIRSEIENGLERIVGGTDASAALTETADAVDTVVDRARDADPRS